VLPVCKRRLKSVALEMKEYLILPPGFREGKKHPLLPWPARTLSKPVLATAKGSLPAVCQCYFGRTPPSASPRLASPLGGNRPSGWVAMVRTWAP
jgi:hypothetical protein